jgi:hypothetical protein
MIIECVLLADLHAAPLFKPVGIRRKDSEGWPPHAIMLTGKTAQRDRHYVTTRE